MKKLISVLAALIALSACGHGYQAADGAGAQSASLESSSIFPPTANTAPVLPTAMAQDVGQQAGSAIIDALLSAVQGAIVGGQNQVSQNGTISKTVACRNGGTVSLTGALTLDSSLSLSGGTIGLSNGSGQLVFSACRLVDVGGEALTLDGTVTVNPLTSSALLSLNLLTASTLTTSGNTAMQGSLTLTSSVFTGTCEFDYSAAYSTSSSFNVSTFAINGTATANATGTLCGTSLSGQQSFNFNL